MFGGKEQRAELRVREFREFGTASLRGITVLGPSNEVSFPFEFYGEGG